jgi:transglutaminase-like putative cysteine protease
MIEMCNRTAPWIRVLHVPPGTVGTLATARLIAELIRQGAKEFCVRQKAIHIFRLACVRPKDRFGEVAALFHWVRQNIRYTRDIHRVELLHTARRMIDVRAGDCDDMTILLGSMLMATGHPVRLVLVGFRPNKPNAYSHIYPEVKVHGRWIALDATMNRPLGWAPPSLWKCICEITKEDLRCSSKTG